jgi:hypothetical protein
MNLNPEHPFLAMPRMSVLRIELLAWSSVEQYETTPFLTAQYAAQIQCSRTIACKRWAFPLEGL